MIKSNNILIIAGALSLIHLLYSCNFTEVKNSKNTVKLEYKIYAWNEDVNPRRTYFQTLEIIKRQDTSIYVYRTDSIQDNLNSNKIVSRTGSFMTMELTNDSILTFEGKDTLKLIRTENRIVLGDTIKCMDFEPLIMVADGLVELIFNPKIGIVEYKGGWNTHYKISKIERINE